MAGGALSPLATGHLGYVASDMHTAGSPCQVGSITPVLRVQNSLVIITLMALVISRVTSPAMMAGVFINLKLFCRWLGPVVYHHGTDTVYAQVRLRPCHGSSDTQCQGFQPNAPTGVLCLFSPMSTFVTTVPIWH